MSFFTSVIGSAGPLRIRCGGSSSAPLRPQDSAKASIGSPYSDIYMQNLAGLRLFISLALALCAVDFGSCLEKEDPSAWFSTLGLPCFGVAITLGSAQG